MQYSASMRRRTSLWLLAALILSQVAGLGIAPKSVLAATTAPSSEPSEEIVYLSDTGIIRIYDREPNPNLPGNATVDWESPTGGWEYLALGDFNNDTDMEIAALRQSGDNFVWAVFDPVLARGGGDPNRKTPNGIPWDILYESQPEPGIIQFIISGNFDVNIPGDELAIGWQDANNRSYVRIMKAAGSTIGNDGNPTGRGWEMHTQRDFDQRYSFAASGQIYISGISGLGDSPADELVLIDKHSARSRMDVFAIDKDWYLVDAKSSTSQELREVAIGQMIAGGPEEIALIRSTQTPTENSLLVYEVQIENGIWGLEDEWTWAFAPKPETVFLADITGNGDQEVWFLRKHPSEDGARLIMRDEWGNDSEIFEDDPIEKSLSNGGADNGFLAGVGADVDGDGKDEVVIMRDDRIRVYTRPDESTGDSTISEHRVPTNSRTILAGNLDAIGFVEGPSFGTNLTRIEASVPVGTTSGNWQVQVNNITTATPVTFSVLKPANATWINVNPTVATTPATINVSFDARNLEVGVYTSELSLNAAGVLNSPFPIEVELTVTPAVISFQPNAVVNVTCVAGDTGSPYTLNVNVGGTNGLNYRGAVIASPDETTAASQEAQTARLAEIAAGAELAANGDIILYDAQGNTRTIPTGIPAGLPSGGDVSASAVLSTAWPIDSTINWITSVTSDRTSVPSNLTIVIDTSVLGEDYDSQTAVLTLVADSRAGTPPDNVFLLPITTMCATSQLMLPVVPSAPAN